MYVPTGQLKELMKVIAEKHKNAITAENSVRYFKGIILSIFDKESLTFWENWLETSDLNYK